MIPDMGDGEQDDGPLQWWDDDVPEGDETKTRGKDHPDGFSFLLPPSDKFWTVWLQFTSQELGRLNYLRWIYEHQLERVS